MSEIENDKNGSIHGYFGLTRNDAGLVDSFCYMLEEQKVIEWLEGKKEDKKLIDQSLDNSNLSADATKLDEAMRRAVSFTHGQREMVVLSCIMAPALAERIVQEEIVEPMLSSGTIHLKTDKGEIHAIPKSPFKWFVPAREKLYRTRAGLSVLPQAAFMGLISSFDSSLADIIATMLRIKPEKLHQSGKSVALADIIIAKSLDDIVEKVISDELYTLFRGSHQEQVKFIESNFNIQIIDHWKRWPDYIEIFERRNLVAHGERSFTKRYVDICSSNNHKGCEKLLGNEIHLTIKYMHQSIDVLLEFIILLIFSFWRKHLPDQISHLFDSVNYMIYNLIENKRYNVAIRIAEYIINLNNSGADDATLRMITINLASAYLHIDDESACKKTLSKMDWSACSDNYKICVTALNKNEDEFVRLMDNVVGSKSVSINDFREWPAFDYMRSSEKVRGKFLELFGEDLLTVEPAQLSEASSEAHLAVGDEKTVH